MRPRLLCRSAYSLPIPASLLLAALAAMLTAPSQARADEWKSPLRAGAWAAEFGTNLGSDYGYALGTAILSVKRHRSERTAFRWSLGFNFREGEGEGSTATSDLGVPQSPGTLDEHDQTNFLSTTIQWMAYRPTNDRVALYLAAGPTFRYSHGSNRELRDQLSSFDFYEYGTVQRFVGLQASLGFAWFFANRLSLGGAVDARGGYEWGNRYSTSEYVRYSPPYSSLYKRNVRTQDVQFATTGTTLTLTAYF
jgi:hypothetical protein